MAPNHTAIPSGALKKRDALLVALILAALACALVAITVGDGPFRRTAVPPGRESRAALAIRDDVTTFQKWGSHLFTWGYLKRYYDNAWYFTQPAEDALKEEFMACLGEALEQYTEVDLFLLAHTNHYVKWVKELPEKSRQRLRLIYNTGCHDQTQYNDWLELGADTYVGHPGVTWSPIFYYFFLRRWARGQEIELATEISNRRMKLTLHAWERITFGYWNAEELIKETIATHFGNARLRIQDRIQ
jgi:hypothetical protein